VFLVEQGARIIVANQRDVPAGRAQGWRIERLAKASSVFSKRLRIVNGHSSSAIAPGVG
jgi:hypothetical protein